MKRNIIIALCILLVGMALGMLCRPKGYIETTIVQRDTTVVRDTLTIEKPVAVTRVTKDTVLVSVTDTIRMRDTLYIGLPMERKTYKGDDYYAEVSGYMPSLDVISVYPKTEYVTETRREIVRQRNYLSAGAEMLYADAFHFYIYAEYERMLHRNVSLSVRALHDVATQSNGMSIGIKAQIGW